MWSCSTTETLQSGMVEQFLTSSNILSRHTKDHTFGLKGGVVVAQCSAVQCIAWSAVQCSAVQCSRVQCSAVQCSAVQQSAVQCLIARYTSAWGNDDENGNTFLELLHMPPPVLLRNLQNAHPNLQFCLGQRRMSDTTGFSPTRLSW